MDVNNLCHWNVVQDVALTKAKEVNVTVDIVAGEALLGETLEEALRAASDGLVLPVHLDTQDCGCRVSDVPFEPWE